MLILSGTLLVLATWCVAAVALMSLGLPLALATSAVHRRDEVVRAALWWGLLVVAVWAYLVHLALPLQSRGAGVVLVVTVLALGVPGWILLLRRPRSEKPESRNRHVSTRALGATSALVVLVLALAALGPVTNYDSGLYHLQAIHYTAKFATVPGLANVFFPLGYGNAEFPLAALMGVGPWGGDGFRLLNGLLISLGLLDLVIRCRSRQLSAGFFVLLVGMLVVVITMLPLSDYWVTSPTQDSAVFLVTVIATAYLSDSVTTRNWLNAAGALGALSIVLVLLRPTMAAFAVTAFAVLAVVAWTRRGDNDRGLGRVIVIVAVSAVVAGVAAGVRDYVLSGWLQYPLSLHAFNVPWLAADPTSPRLATLGAARNGDDLWHAAVSMDWIPVWFSRVPRQWEFWAMVCLVVAATVALTLAGRRTSVRVRRLMLAMAPSIVATAFWWAFTPPSFRFAWGPLFTVATIPVGWALWRLNQRRAFSLPRSAIWAGAGVMVVMCVVTVTGRLHLSTMTEVHRLAGIPLEYEVTPVLPGDVVTSTNAEGLQVRAPRQGEQCWSAYPTCSPQLPATLRLRGEGIQQGYLP